MPHECPPLHPDVAWTRSCRTALAVVALATVCAVASATEDHEQRFVAITARAEAAREKGSYEEVEIARRERWDLVKTWAAEANKADAHPLVAGYRAIYDADGDEDVVGEPGLVDRLEYTEAAKRLKSAWNAMAEANGNKGPVLGEVATRLFELVQQAVAIHPDSRDPASSRFIMSDDDLLQVLDVAARRDPCAVMAIPMREWLKKLDPREAFLRAEVRPTLKARQQALVGISHPAIFPGIAATSQNEVTVAAVDSRAIGAENADAAMLPWHAVTEFVKADGLNAVLNDVDATRVLDLEWISRGPVQHVIPANVLTGSDAEGDPLAILYGRFFYVTLPDRHGRTRSAVLVIGKNNRWDAYYMDLLWRTPRGGREDRDALKAYEELVRTLEPRFTFALGPEKFTVYKFPALEMERLLRMEVPQMVVDNVNDLRRMTFSETQNDSRSVLEMLATRGRGTSSLAALARPELWASFGEPAGNFYTSAGLLDRMRSYIGKGDRTRHPLIDLTADFNPIVIISPRPNTKTFPAEISTMRDDRGRPYVNLADGRRLLFNLSKDDKGPCSFIEADGYTAYMPLRMTAVPPGIVTGSPLGRTFVELLTDVGYTNTAAVAEIAKLFEDPTHIPAKFEKKLRAMSAQTRMHPSLAMYDLLREKGYTGRSLILAQELSTLFFASGFRYVVDARGNMITNREVAYAMADAAAPNNANAPPGQNGGPNNAQNMLVNDVRAFPYDFRAPDGERTLPRDQIYSWEDYMQINDNLFAEHISKMLSFHPCLPAMSFAEASAERTLTHPADRKPTHLENNTNNAPGQQSQQQGGGAQNNGAPNVNQKAGSWWIADSLSDELFRMYGISIGILGTGGAVQTTAEAKKADKTNLASHKVLDGPIKAWAVHDDDAGAQSLSNLQRSLTKAYLRTANLDAVLKRYVRVLATLEEWRNELVSEEAQKAVYDLRTRAEMQYAERYSEWFTSAQPILAVHLEDTRHSFRNRFYHRAIVKYNDLLRQLTSSEQRSPFSDLGAKVPDTASVQRFLQRIELAVSGAQLVVTVQLELAATLEAAGFRDSARFIRQRIVNDHAFYLTPLLAESRSYVASYGLRLSDRAESTISAMTRAADVAGIGLGRDQRLDEWRDVPRDTTTAANKTFMSVVERVSALLNAVEGSLADENTAGVDGSVERELAVLLDEGARPQDAPSLNSWLRLRQALVIRPLMLFHLSDPSTSSLIRQATPARYVARPDRGNVDEDAADGFIQSVLAIVRDTDVDALAAWCTQPAEVAMKDENAAANILLIAWYWLDHGDKIRAKDALLSLVEQGRARAETAAEGSVEKFVAELDTSNAMAASSGIVANLPGISALRVDFSSAMVPLLMEWSRRWLAAGHYGPHAESAIAAIKSQLVQNATQALVAESSWQSRRYYFADYRNTFGSIPDSLAERLLDNPELFRPADAQQVAAQGQAAVDENAGRLLTEAHAVAWLEKQRVDLRIEVDDAGQQAAGNE
jgi:hypothetical protein